MLGLPLERMNWRLLQQEVEERFRTETGIGGLVTPVIRAELEHEQIVDRKYRGHAVLSSSFQQFLLQSVVLASDRSRSHPTPATEPWMGNYYQIIEWSAAAFRILRAVDVLFHRGYPLDGLARLRTVKDLGLRIFSVAQGKRSAVDILGLSSKAIRLDGSLDKDQMIKDRKNVERDLRAYYFEDVALEDDRRLLKEWDDNFHNELHVAEFSITASTRKGNGKIYLSLSPVFDEKRASAYFNAWNKVAWILHRGLTGLNLAREPFDSSWGDDWRLLDQYFRAMNTHDDSTPHGPTAAAFIRWLDSKLTLDPSRRFGPDPS